jgi:uncharacterized membrane protein
MGKSVRFLVGLAAFIVAAGGVLYLVRFHGVLPGLHSFQGEPVSLRTIRGILCGAASLDPCCLIQLGILLLIAIPIIRVLSFFISYLFKRDWLYSLFALAVLGMLAFSLLGNVVG